MEGQESTFAQRLLGALKLDALTYHEIGVDPEASKQAAVVFVAVATITAGTDAIAENRKLVEIALGLLSWPLGVLELAWIWAVGVRIYPKPDPPPRFVPLLRVMAFAMTPLVFSPLVLVPEMETVFSFVIGLWALACAAVALRVVFGYESVWDAVGLYVVAVGVIFVPAIVVIFAVFFLLSP